jgi:alkaline phosphatase D
LWIPAALLLAISVFAVPAAMADDPPVPVEFTHGVASGDVTSTRAILWTRVNVGTNIKVEVWDNAALSGPKAFNGKLKTSAARDYTVKIDATGLEPNTQYWYRFKKDAVLSPVGTFQTAPSASESEDVSLTYTGDSDGTGGSASPPFNNFEVLDAANNEGGDFFIYNGDTIYADSSFRVGGPADTLPEYRDAYKENRTFANLTDLFAATSTYATWDDHEVVNDYDGQTVDPARYAAGRQAFLEYMPIRESFPHDPSCAGDPIYRTFKWGSEAEVFILDARSCRSADSGSNNVSPPCYGDLAPTAPTALRTSSPFNLFLAPTPPAGCLASINNPARTLLGPVQKAQLKSDLASSTAKFKIVVNPEPIQQFLALPYDRWEGYAADRNEILDHISNNGIDNVLFASTDTHATLINQVFKDAYTAPATIANEGVVGPIATNTYQAEVIAQTGFLGLFALNLVLNQLGIDCRDLDTDTYGSIDVSASAGTAVLASKDNTGAVIPDQNVGTTFCSNTYGP